LTSRSHRQGYSRWSPARRRIVEQAYGQWLSFLERNGARPVVPPGERATEARLSEFVAELRARVAPMSAAMMLGALVRMLSVLEPGRDWGTLARVYNHLRQTAAPSRDKLSCLVRASDLFELGLRLMDTCEDGPDRPAYVATRYRDGLLVALLIACPIRIKNLGNLVIGQHLVFDG
jgi:integrase/recombinase XerD